MTSVAALVLVRDPSNHEVEDMVHQQISASLDLQGTGLVQRDEILEALGRVVGEDLLQ
jgi:hypothetical protein